MAKIIRLESDIIWERKKRVQEVIDRMLKFGDEYTEELEKLNNSFTIKTQEQCQM